MKYLLLLFVSINIYSQTEFKFDKDGFTDFIVGECEGKSQSELYKKAIEWISINYKNPKEVIKATIENDYIRIEGSEKCLVALNVLGKNCFTSKYQLEFSFKDGKYKLDFIDVTSYIPASQNSVGRWYTENFENINVYFKDSGELRSRYKYYMEIPIYFNKINTDLKNYLNSNNANPSKKNDW